MPKFQSHVRTKEGHTFRSAVFDHTPEEITDLMDYLEENWGDIRMIRVTEEEGYTCIPRDNLSSFSFREVDES